jgi:hypothetical protein
MFSTVKQTNVFIISHNYAYLCVFVGGARAAKVYIMSKNPQYVTLLTMLLTGI